MAALPEMPEGATGNTARTHQGLLLARETFDAGFPAPPTDRAYASLQSWVDTTVVAWVERRRAMTEATRERFLLEGEPSEGERIVSHAVLGLIYEDTALSLSSIPSPSELDSEPDIAGMYQDIIRTQAESFVSSALLELRECADRAYRGPPDMRPWATFCHARFDRLRDRNTPKAEAAGNVASKAQ